MNKILSPRWFLRTANSGSASLRRLALVAQRSGGRKRRDLVRLIRASALFDERWYLDKYPDVAAARIDPLRHFLDSGWREGRDPSPRFSTSAYLKANSDVARSGINPLVHFLEFGQSEGREVLAHNPRIRRLAAVHYKFEPPAPVFRGTISQQPASPWLQHYRFAEDDHRLLSAGGWGIGYADGPARVALERSFEGLAHLSGYAPAGAKFFGSAPEASAELLDAWFINDGQLRTRWSAGSFPSVVRAYQHDQLSAGSLQLVAEALVESPLDFADASVSDPYFPILFVFAEPDGAVTGSELLAFPSMCRGGIHYAELIAASNGGHAAPDAVGTGRAEAARLLSVRERRRLVTAIAVDLAGADGSTPLFRAEFREWLRRVAGVVVEPLDGSTGPAASLLIKDAADRPAAPGGTLVLGADMIPTIGALSEAAGGIKADNIFLPLLIAQPDPSEPAILAEVPPDAPEVFAAMPSGYPAPWPRWRRDDGALFASTFVGAAAVRLADGRPLSEAELLVPASGQTLPIASMDKARDKASITWLILVDEWDSPEIVEAARALAFQSGPLHQVIGFIGEPQQPIRDSVAAVFRGRVRVYCDMAAAACGVGTDFAGYLGPGIILHDTRTSELLLSMLEEPRTASAACVLVTTEKRGKSWQVTVVDAGAIPGADGGRSIAAQAAYAQHFWRASYPVALPPRDLWLARTSAVKTWFLKQPASRIEEGMHVCTAAVTAGYSSQRRRGRATVSPPRLSADRAIQTRTLFG